MSGKENHSVALIAANYNNGTFLNEFIDSILSSSVLPAQVIIVDDGSTDNSQEILSQYIDKKPFEIVLFKENTGFANALNTAIGRVTSAFTLRADPDDLLHPLKIEKQLDFLLQNPDIAGVGCNVEYFHSESRKMLHTSNFPLSPDEIRKAYQKGEHGLQHPAVMIRSEVLKQFCYHQSSVPAEDYELFASMVKSGYKFQNLKEALYKMRIHPASSSSKISFSTIRKTYSLRNEIFGRKASLSRQLMYYLYIRNYRNYMLSVNPLRKYICLFIAIFCYPSKLMKRFKR